VLPAVPTAQVVKSKTIITPSACPILGTPHAALHTGSVAVEWAGQAHPAASPTGTATMSTPTTPSVFHQLAVLHQHQAAHQLRRVLRLFRLLPHRVRVPPIGVNVVVMAGLAPHAATTTGRVSMETITTGSVSRLQVVSALT
jgi:hypothetical protein